MKTIDEIRAEIANIDRAMESRIEDYKRGVITGETLNADKARFETAKNALLWVIK